MDTDYVVINSEDRDTTLYPYSNSYTMFLPNPIRYVTRVELVQASIPNVIENVTDGTDFIQVSNVVNDSLHAFSIPNGFYSGQGLLTTVQNAINLESNIVASFLVNEGRYLFYRPAGDGDFKLQPSALMARLMGFSDTTVRTSATVTDEPGTSSTFSLYANNTQYRGKTFLKSDRIVNLSTDDQIFLDISELNSVWMEQMNKLNETTASQNNFGPIPMDVDSGKIKHFNSTKDYAYGTNFKPAISQISRLTVKWRKLNGETIQFENAQNNSFMLRIYSTFRKGELVPQ